MLGLHPKEWKFARRSGEGVKNSIPGSHTHGDTETGEGGIQGGDRAQIKRQRKISVTALPFPGYIKCLNC